MLPRRPNAGRAKISELPLGINKRALCRWCGLEVPIGRRSFCGSDCIHEYRIRTQPRYVRECVYKRDNGYCALCNVNTKEIAQQLLNETDKERLKDLLTLYNISSVLISRQHYHVGTSFIRYFQQTRIQQGK